MENFIEEILTQLIEEANEIKKNALDDFEKGKLYGYYESISKILNQAESFGVFDKLPKNLQEFKPEDFLNEIN
ncbi:MAG TPA: hypothetical protein PKZ43_08575 [Bacteroidales bacterium]|nr:hypothetical protein [Bacteroidales bacterium]